MTNKTDRATEIYRAMTPHQMALRIVELEDVAEIVGQAVSDRSKRITELQDALELAEEAVRAKHFPDAAKMVHDGWKVVPVEPTREMWAESGDAVARVNGIAVHRDIVSRVVYDAMLAAAPKYEGGAA